MTKSVLLRLTKKEMVLLEYANFRGKSLKRLLIESAKKEMNADLNTPEKVQEFKDWYKDKEKIKEEFLW